MCNITANINAASMIRAGTLLLEAKDSLTLVCVCVCVYVVWHTEKAKRRGGKRDRIKMTVISADCMTSAQEDSVYAFVFSAHMHLNLALRPSASLVLK